MSQRALFILSSPNGFDPLQVLLSAANNASLNIWRYLHMKENFSRAFLEVELPGHRSHIYTILLDITKLLFKIVVPIYLLTSSVKAFLCHSSFPAKGWHCLTSGLMMGLKSSLLLFAFSWLNWGRVFFHICCHRGFIFRILLFASFICFSIWFFSKLIFKNSL